MIYCGTAGFFAYGDRLRTPAVEQPLGRLEIIKSDIVVSINLRVHFLSVRIIRALLFWVCIRAPDFGNATSSQIARTPRSGTRECSKMVRGGSHFGIYACQLLVW